jgi:hypothetical protein
MLFDKTLKFATKLSQESQTAKRFDGSSEIWVFDYKN